MLLIYLFLAVLGLRCCVGVSPAAVSGDYSLGVVGGRLVAVASPVVENRFKAQRPQQLQHMGSVIPARGFSCSEACGIFRHHGSNLRLPHWQVDSSPLSCQGSPQISSLFYFILFVYLFIFSNILFL